MKKKIRTAVFTASVWSLVLAVQTYAGGTWHPPLSGDCKVPPNQMGSFYAPLPHTLRLLVDNRFSKNQKKEIQAAAAEWNKQGQKIRGSDFFKVEFVDVPAGVLNGTTPPFGGTDFAYVLHFNSNDDWTSFRAHVPGTKDDFEAGGVNFRREHITGTVGAPKHELLEQFVAIKENETNYQSFRGVALHELGHALGLSHSCDSGAHPNGADPQYVSCSDVLKIPQDPYYQAVMYPSYRVLVNKDLHYIERALEVKDYPMTNDLTRLECLYGPPKAVDQDVSSSNAGSQTSGIAEQAAPPTTTQ